MVEAKEKTERRINKDRYYERNPWAKKLKNMRWRCHREGLHTNIDLAKVKEIWDRDGAGKMKNPHLIRKDVTGQFLMGNVKFVEGDIVHQRD